MPSPDQSPSPVPTRFRIPPIADSWLLATAALVVYLRTMSPGVGTEDPGEIAAMLHTMGIAHPTGYPLYTMLGSLFVRLLPGDPDIWRMNLFGAVLTAVAVFLFHGTFRLVFSPKGGVIFGWDVKVPDDVADRFAAAAATAVFAFSGVFWFEAVSERAVPPGVSNRP
jgi:hypothetical protein